MNARVKALVAVLLFAGCATAANQQRVIVEQSGMNGRQTVYWAYLHSINRPDVHLHLVCNIGARRCQILTAGDEMNYEVSNEKKDQLYNGVNVALWGDEDEHYLLYGLAGSETY
jgi:hypothetical protein